MLSVVLIAKDEARSIGRALASVAGAGEVIVCDTGSRDGTMSIADAAGARVCEWQWHNDFAAARTYAQTHAKYPWVMRLDADEVLEVSGGRPAEWFAEAIGRAERVEADRIFVRRRYHAQNEHWFLRMFRADRFVWAKPLHEILVPSGDRRRAIAMRGAVVVHYPSARSRGYSALARLHLARRPEDAHLRYYLARSLWEEGPAADAVMALHTYLQQPRDYRYHRGEAHRMLGCALASEWPDEARRHLVEAAFGDGTRSEALVDLVRLSLAVGDRAGARRWIEVGAYAVAPREPAPWGGTRLPYLLDREAWRQNTWRDLWRAAA